MKKSIYRFLAVVLLLFTALTAGCSAAPGLGSMADMSGYEGLTDKENHVFIVSDVDDFIKKMEQRESFVAYFGFDTCPWCNSVISILNDLGKENNQEILYINTRPNKQVTANNQLDNYDKLYSRIGEYWEPNLETGENYLFVPFVIFVKNGEVAASHMGTVEGHLANIQELTEDQAYELREIYKEGFNSLIQ